MLVKNECQANNKKVSWSTEKEKTNKRKGWKGTTKRERERERERERKREREREAQSDLLRMSYTSWPVCTLLFIHVLN